jgi:OFA family oxalate/formate antiporter-like MFS transporter
MGLDEAADGVGGDASATAPKNPLDNCWVQLGAGILGMVAITNLQYGWTFFTGQLGEKFGWSRETLSVSFTLFVLAETWLVPFEGYFVDRFGPRLPVAIGGLLIIADWVWKAFATSLPEFYISSLLGGAGAGVVYGTSIATALKWFSRRRGLAAGLTSAAFGAGSALTVLPLTHTIRHFGYDQAFLWFGIGQGAIVLLCASLLRFPPPDLALPAGTSKVRETARDFTWWEMLKTPAFWLMYGMMILVSIGGLTLIEGLRPLAEDYGVAVVPMVLFGFTLTALELAAQVDRILNGITRPFFGWISDHLGRENTMCIAFALQGIAIVIFLVFAHTPLMFVLLTGLVFFAWGEIYSLFPATCGDMFGRKFATTNYGLLYTAKGTASLLVPAAIWFRAAMESWTPVLLVFSGLAWIVALAALLVLKPLHARMKA